MGRQANKSELNHTRPGRVLAIRDAPTSGGAEPAGGATRVPTPAGDVLFMTPNVANWLYQAFVDVLTGFQTALDGGGAFDASGAYLTKAGAPASGGEIVAWWGTEVGSRRDQSIIAWDYDVDFAVFVTPDMDVGSLWRRVSRVLRPLGLRATQHKKFKFRVGPTKPIVWHEWRELYQETREQNMSLPRPRLIQTTASLWRRGQRAARPHGVNCGDIEVYVVRPDHDLRITEATKPFWAPTKSLFPIVEGALGPLRVPLPRTPIALDKEYGNRWRHTYVAKVIHGSGAREVTLTKGYRRAVWPSAPLVRCERILGVYQAASTQAAKSDVPWRKCLE